MMRSSRPRRPGSMFGQGNPLYGVTGKFGLIGLLVLFITGLLVQVNKPDIDVNALQAVEVTLNAKPLKLLGLMPWNNSEPALK